MRALALLLLAGCCDKAAPPVWMDLDPVSVADGSATVALSDYILGDADALSFEATGTDDVIASVYGDTLEVAGQPDWTGTTTVTVTATDACGNSASADLTVTTDALGGDDTGAPTVPDGCPVTLSYTAQGAPDAVAVAGTFNDWSTDADRLTGSSGTWSTELRLQPGAYPYKFVEVSEGLYGDEARWACDPNAPYIQCDAGYKTADDADWSQDCGLDAGGCNSLLVVPNCLLPTLTVTAVSLDRGAGTARVTVSATAGEGGEALTEARATLDGVALDDAWTGAGFDVSLSGLSATRHVLRFEVTDAGGNTSEQVSVPFWMDEHTWDQAVLYYAFVDRVADGDPSLNVVEGASVESGEYLGGDWQGLIDLLPYLDDLGVTAIWITNPQDNIAGDWDGQCEATYTGYHGYWPVSSTALEEHFGDESTLRDLVDAAHARNMRVLADWVGNHVHEDHELYLDHPDWFGDYAWCEDADNWNDIPETCWFAPYLPDVDYTQPEPLVRMVDDAVQLAVDWDLDGLRVDAAKHMPHSVQWNLESAIQQRIEHTAAGGEDVFWTVGETFDGYERIADYIGEHELDGQFDFPLYYSLRGAFLDESTSLPDLMSSRDSSLSAFSGATMGLFLGNHDVSRFVTAGSESDTSACDSDGSGVRVASPPTDPAIYAKLRLAWTFLFTSPGVPLIYYGDELGMPGYADPDNRQPLFWYADMGLVGSVADLADQLDADEAATVEHVAALARARATHPALGQGSTIEWWREDDLYAYARTSGEDAVLVILNRSTTDRSLSNGLSFAGLPSATYEDVLTGDTFTASGDSLSVTVSGRGSRVLVAR